MQTANRPPPAPLYRRLLAAILDAAALVVIYRLLFELFLALDRCCGNRLRFGGFVAAGLVAVALPGAYLFLFHLIRGQTPGKMLLKIRVRDRAGGSLTARQILIRTVMQYFSSGLLGAGYLAVFFNRERRAFHDLVADTLVCPTKKGDTAMTTTNAAPGRIPRGISRRARIGLSALAAVLIAVIVLKTVFYKVPENQTVLHLRGGKFMGELKPGLHTMVPILDDVVRVNMAEQQGYIQHIDAMTADNVIMKVSLQYTFVVTNAVKYGLEVREPFKMIYEFVQGRLRDIINTRSMDEVAHNRKEISEEVSRALADSQEHFGVRFRLVQIQATYPPEEVAQAIRERMVSEQRKQAATSDAEKEKILADATFYSANRVSEARAMEVEKIAAAQQKSISAMLGELQKSPELGKKYLDLLIAQELKSNSKWVISGAAPTLMLQEKE